MSVKRNPEISSAASHLYRNDAAPAPETAVIIVEYGIFHAIFAVDPVVGPQIKIITADKESLAIHGYEAAAGFRSGIGSTDVTIAV